MNEAETKPINILQPFGTPLFPKPGSHATPDPENTDEVIGSGEEVSSNFEAPRMLNRINGGGFSQEMEDIVAEYEVLDSRSTFDLRVTLDGKVMGKAKALAIRSKYRHMSASQDRLKHYEAISRFNPSNDSFASTPTLRGSSLIIHDPIASVLRCEDRLFVCIGKVTNIQVESHAMDQIVVEMLAEKIISVSFQLIYLVSCLKEDDPSGRYDWRSQ